MNKIFRLACVAVLVSLGASCTKEIAPVEEEAAPAGEELVTVSFGVNVATKAFVESDGTVKFEESDLFAIYDGTAIRQFTVKAGSVDETGTSAIITGEIDADATTLSAMYPFSAASLSGSALAASIPDVQTIASGKMTDGAAMILSASGAVGSSLEFGPSAAMLSFTVADGVNRVIFHTKAMEAIAGTSPCLEVNIPGGAAGTYFASVNAGSYQGIRVFTDNGTNIYLKEGNGTLTTTAGVIKTLGAVASSTEVKAVCTRADMTALATAPGVPVYLCRDLNLAGEAWIPQDFTGTFEGQYHRVYNITASPATGYAGFLKSVGDYSVVKNFCAGSSDYDFATKTGNYDGVSAITLNEPSAGYGYAGLLAYVRKGSYVENVVNFASLTASSACGAHHRMAGVAGTLKAEVTMKDCINFGTVTDNSVVTTGNYKSTLGGVSGAVDGNGTVMDGCINKGAVTNNSKELSIVGGVCAVIFYSGTVTGCVNEGVVNNNADCVGFGNGTGYVVRVGGVVGATVEGSSPAAGNALIEKCINKGAVKQSVDLTKADCNLAIGGVLGISNMLLTTIKGCVNEAEISIGAVFTHAVCLGGILGYSTGGSYETIITKADDGTLTQNKGYLNQLYDNKNTTYVGGIAGYYNQKNTSRIEYSTNSGEIYMSKEASTITISIGGIAGALIGYIDNCSNTARIRANGAANNHTSRTGGIVGGATADKHISNCSNSGELQLGKGVAASRLGGIAASFYPAQKDEMTYCTNTGLLNASRGTVVRIGGLAGYCEVNKGTTDLTILEGCVLNYTLQVSKDAYSAVDTNTDVLNGNSGMVFGGFGGTWGARYIIGTSANKLRVGGKVYQSTEKITYNITEANLYEHFYGKGEAYYGYLDNFDVTNVVLY